MTSIPPPYHPFTSPPTDHSSTSEYRCNHPNCGKTFTRKDHLIRHAANHQETNFFCSTCNRGFKRLDLLHRHEKRNICSEDNSHPSPNSKRQRTESFSTSDDLSSSQQQLPRVIHPPPQPISQPPSHRDSLSMSFSHPHSQPDHHEQQQQNHGHHPQQLSIHSAGGSSVPPSSSNGESSSFPPLSGSSMTIASTSNNPNSNPNADLNSNPVAIAFANAMPADFEILTTQEWGYNPWQPDPWDVMLHDTLAPPFNEPSYIPDLSWSIPTPRVQESAERGSESLASAALVAKLQLALPEFEITLPFLTESLLSYWTNIAPTFPFIHHGTFDINTALPELIAMMAIVGSTQLSTSTSSTRPNFRKVVSRIRGVLVQDCGFEMPLSTLQTFCLCHVHDTWYGTAETQFVAQCMWPVMVAHSRKKGIGVVGRPENEEQEEEAWSSWAKDEERRRAAFCVLLIDTQLSAFWNQHPSRQLSIFAHNIVLPCPRNQWEAPTASDWIRLREPPKPSPVSSRKARSGFLPGLHPEFGVNTVSEGYSASVLSALAAEAKLPFRVDIEGALGVEMILIGLMAIAWDCRTRGGMGIRFRDGTKHWRAIVLNAVINLRAAWEFSSSHVPPCIDMRDLRDTFAISIISVLCDIPMLQVAAGATIVCGASIGPRQYKDAQRRLRLWGKTEDAWTCLWQSARFLRQTMFADWGIYSSWAVYLTTLVHWAYAWTLSKDSDRISPSTDNPAHKATTLLDLILSSPTRLDQIDFGISDLIVCTAEKLSMGEEIERECSGLLWRLIGNSSGGKKR